MSIVKVSALPEASAYANDDILYIIQANTDTSMQIEVGTLQLTPQVQLSGTAQPSSGGPYTKGTIVWNSNPALGGVIGWVCLIAGSPGSWAAFGQIALDSLT
jgi:hypothetical protein